MTSLAGFSRKASLLVRYLTVRGELPSRSASRIAIATFCRCKAHEVRGLRYQVLAARASAAVEAKPRWFCTRGRSSDVEQAEADENNGHGLGRVGVAGLQVPSSALQQTESNIVKMRSWPFHLPSPFGKLMVEDTLFPVRIVPANVHDFPEGNRVFVHLLATVPKGLSAQFELASFQDVIANIACSLVEKDIVLMSHGDVDDATPLWWLIEVPTCYDIQVSSKSEGHISVENLENEECSIQTEHGNISLKSMKSAHVKVHSDSGHIMCIKALQGSGVIETKEKGTVNADKLQGLDFTVQSEAGPIHIKDIYARRSKVTSQRGPITINNMHTNCTISTRANVDTGSVEGFMSAVLSGAGKFRGYLSRHDSVHIKTEQGHIDIRVPEDCRSKVDLTGQNVEIDGALLFRSTQPSDDQRKIGDLHGGGENATITATTEEGSITVKTLSWFDSLGLTR